MFPALESRLFLAISWNLASCSSVNTELSFSILSKFRFKIYKKFHQVFFLYKSTQTSSVVLHGVLKTLSFFGWDRNRAQPRSYHNIETRHAHIYSPLPTALLRPYLMAKTESIMYYVFQCQKFEKKFFLAKFRGKISWEIGDVWSQCQKSGILTRALKYSVSFVLGSRPAVEVSLKDWRQERENGLLWMALIIFAHNIVRTV